MFHCHRCRCTDVLRGAINNARSNKRKRSEEGSARTIEDEPVGSTERVRDLDKSRTSLSGEGPCSSVATSRKKQVVGSTSFANGVDGLLDGVNPESHIAHIVGLVHDTKYGAIVLAVLLSELCPQARELCIGGAALADDLAVPASIVVLPETSESFKTS